MEIDTTELFNSPFKKQKQIASIGGILEFDQQVSLQDSNRLLLESIPGSSIGWRLQMEHVIVYISQQFFCWV